MSKADTSTGTVAWTSQFVGCSTSMVLAHDGRTLFVLNTRSSTVLPLVASTGVIGPARANHQDAGPVIPAGSSTGGHEVYVLFNGQGRRIWIIPIRTSDNKAGSRIALDGRPFGMLFGP